MDGRRFLTAEQMAQYGQFADDPDEIQLARYFHLLATNAVVLWNTLYMQAALDHLRQQPQEVRE